MIKTILNENVGMYNKKLGIYCALAEKLVVEKLKKYKLEHLFKSGFLFNMKDWELIKKWKENDYKILKVKKGKNIEIYEYSEEDKVPGTKTIWNSLKEIVYKEDNNNLCYYDLVVYPFCETYNEECDILCEYMENHGCEPCGCTSHCGKYISDTSRLECIIEDYGVELFPNKKELKDIIEKVETII